MLPTVISSLLITLMVVSAVQTVRAAHLLTSALWLAGVSASASSLLLLIGAFEIAVIELSLSMGLVTVLLVFAISMIGANTPDHPARTAFFPVLTMTFALFLAGLLMADLTPTVANEQAHMAETLWSQRQIDVLLHIALILVGVLSVLVLLSGLGQSEQILTEASAESESQVTEEMHT